MMLHYKPVKKESSTSISPIPSKCDGIQKLFWSLAILYVLGYLFSLYKKIPSLDILPNLLTEILKQFLFVYQKPDTL